MVWMVKKFVLPPGEQERVMTVECPLCGIYTDIDTEMKIEIGNEKNRCDCGAYLSAAEQLCFFEVRRNL